METIKARGTDSARVIRVIETQSLKGEGTPINPCRIVKQYWDFDGVLLAEKDYHKDKLSKKTLYSGKG